VLPLDRPIGQAFHVDTFRDPAVGKGRLPLDHTFRYQ
jgi:hypothetical protein